MRQYSFEKLEVWQEARAFSVYIYQLTSKFPAEENFGLVSQIRRAAISIASNIAEGSARKSSRDQEIFIRLLCSLIEVLNQLIISTDLNLITKEQLETCRNSIESISNKINSLRRSILDKPNLQLNT